MKSIPVMLIVAALACSCAARTPEPAVPSSPAPAATASVAAAPAATVAISPAAAVKSPRPIGYADLSALLAAPGSSLLLLDVRAKDEFEAGHISGSALMPYDAIKATFVEPDRNRPIVVYCRSGRRSAIAAETLVAMGYTDVSDFGGIDNWKGSLER